jgi:hypothetical protein
LHPVGQHRRSLRALSPLWLTYLPDSFSRLPAPGGYHGCATSRHHRPANPYMVGLTGYLCSVGGGSWSCGTRGAPRAALSQEVGAGPRGHVSPSELPCVGRWALEPWGHVAPPELSCAGRWALEPPPELPRAGRRGGARGTLGPALSRRWALEPRGHVAPSELTRAGRWAPESRGHVAPLELPCTGRWAPEPRRHMAARSCPKPGGGSRSRGDT